MKQDIWMFNLTYDRNGEYCSYADGTIVFDAYTQANNIPTYYIGGHWRPFVLNKEDAMLLKLAGFVTYEIIPTIEELVSILISIATTRAACAVQDNKANNGVTK